MWAPGRSSFVSTPSFSISICRKVPTFCRISSSEYLWGTENMGASLLTLGHSFVALPPALRPLLTAHTPVASTFLYFCYFTSVYILSPHLLPSPHLPTYLPLSFPFLSLPPLPFFSLSFPSSFTPVLPSLSPYPISISLSVFYISFLPLPPLSFPPSFFSFFYL